MFSNYSLSIIIFIYFFNYFKGKMNLNFELLDIAFFVFKSLLKYDKIIMDILI